MAFGRKALVASELHGDSGESGSSSHGSPKSVQPPPLHDTSSIARYVTTSVSSAASSSHTHLSPMEILSGEPISPSALHRAALADSDPSFIPDSALALPQSGIPISNITIIPPKRYTFTQGFLLGQFLFVLMCAAFIKYVVFEDAESGRKRRAERVKKAPLSTTNVPPPSPGSLLEKVGYDMSTHGSESAEWINVLFGQVLQGYRDDLLGSGGEEGARKTFEKWLNPVNSKTSWLDPITVTSLSLGTSYPLLSNARIRPADGQGNLRSEVDLDYTDSVHLNLATSVLVNFPKPRFAVLPVALGIELVGFGGTMTMQIHKTPSPDRDRWQQIHLSLLPDFHLNVKASSLLGSRAKLQDIPKLEQIVISRLQAAIQERIVWPRFIGVGLPRLVSAGREKVDVPPTGSGGQAGEEPKDSVASVVVNGRPIDRMGDGRMGGTRMGSNSEDSVHDIGSPSGRGVQSGNKGKFGSGHDRDGQTQSGSSSSAALGRDELFSPPLMSAGPGFVTSRQTSKFIPPASGERNGWDTPTGLGIAGSGNGIANGSTKPRSNTLPIPNSPASSSTMAMPENSGYPNGTIPLGSLPSPRIGADVLPHSRAGSSYGFPVMGAGGSGGGSGSATAASSVVGGGPGKYGPEDVLRYRGRGVQGMGGGGGLGSPGLGGGMGSGISQADGANRPRGALNSRGR